LVWKKTGADASPQWTQVAVLAWVRRFIGGTRLSEMAPLHLKVVAGIFGAAVVLALVLHAVKDTIFNRLRMV
jgi:hypothetical protein